MPRVRSTSTPEHKQYRFYELTPEQYDRFLRFVDRPSYWTVSNTCASFARDAVYYATGDKLSADDAAHGGADTPWELGESIDDRETGKPSLPTQPIVPLPPTIVYMPPSGLIPPVGITGLVGVTQGPSGGGVSSGPVPKRFGPQEIK